MVHSLGHGFHAVPVNRTQVVHVVRLNKCKGWDVVVVGVATLPQASPRSWLVHHRQPQRSECFTVFVERAYPFKQFVGSRHVADGLACLLNNCELNEVRSFADGFQQPCAYQNLLTFPPRLELLDVSFLRFTYFVAQESVAYPVVAALLGFLYVLGCVFEDVGVVSLQPVVPRFVFQR